MKSAHGERAKQRAVVFVSLLLFQLILLLIQLWLFVSVLESSLEGGEPVGGMAPLLSIACFAANLWMLLGVWRLDRGE